MLLRFQFAVMWKNRELQSPSLIHLVLAFCVKIDAFECVATHESSCSCLLNFISSAVSCLSSPSTSSLLSSVSNLLIFYSMSSNWVLFHSFSLCFSLLIFSFKTKPPCHLQGSLSSYHGPPSINCVLTIWQTILQIQALCPIYF